MKVTLMMCFNQSLLQLYQTEELNHQIKALINTQNVDDNEWLKRIIISYLNPAEHNLGKITKADKDFAKKLHFKNIKLLVKITNTHKLKKKSIRITVFGYENQEEHLISSSKKCWEEKLVDLLLEEGKRRYALIK